MGYKPALEKAWGEIADLTSETKFSLRLLGDEYEIDTDKQTILSLSCNVPAKEYVSIILLHYLIQKLKLKVLPKPVGEWIDFKQMEGGNAYYPAFKKRVIEIILRKYGAHPEALLDLSPSVAFKRAQVGDVGVVIEALPEVPVLITVWRADEEFGAEANILFDKNITKIFCTEDIVVLADLAVRLL